MSSQDTGVAEAAYRTLATRLEPFFVSYYECVEMNDILRQVTVTSFDPC